MAIYLVQHGVALPKEDDPECGLSPLGLETVERIAGVALNYAVPVEKIVHSGKKRAVQTAQLIAEKLKPAQGVEMLKGLAPLDDVVEVADALVADSNLMLVGHLPFMERLVSYLTTGTTEYMPFKFQNGGIVCLDQQEAGGRWFVKWALMPNIG